MAKKRKVKKVFASLASLGESVIAMHCGCKILKDSGIVTEIVLCKNHLDGNPKIDALLSRPPQNLVFWFEDEAGD